MTVNVSGIDHIYIAVRDMERAEAWYDEVMAALGFRKNRFVIQGAPHVQYYNRLFGYVLRPAATGTPAHDAYAPGLHHFCFRVDTAAEVEAVARELHRRGIAASEPATYPEYAPDYVAVFFTDPDGIRLEVTNFRQERHERFEHWDDPNV